ncbi:MAG: hypothetical protein M3N38_02970 [Pseudomonadota bacterium]|nr:hypothetical protein [Pseudomonadota bacterium]
MLKRMQLAAVASLLFGLAAFAPTADAAQVCGPRDKIITALGEQFNENRKSLGLARGAAVVELFVSIGGSWTLVATDTKGVACLIGAGEAWQDAPHVATGQDS